MAEGVPHPPQLIIEGMDRVPKDGSDFIPPLMLISATTFRLSKLKPTTELAFFTGLLSPLASLAFLLLPQQTTVKKRALVTTVW